MFGFINKWFSRDIGIDLGTANTLVYVRGSGIVVREPSVVAIKCKTNTVLAVGDDAKRMIGRTPGDIKAIRPIKDGVIADFEVTQDMLRHFMQKVCSNSTLIRPRVVICVPSGVTAVERKAVKDAARQAGAREAYLMEEPMAAAIGAGLAVHEPTGNMVVDIGGGTTEVGVISLGGIVYAKSIRMAGDEMDRAIINYVKKKYNLLIGERTAEQIKIHLGSARIKTEYDDRKEAVDGVGPYGTSGKTKEVRGRDLVQGLPQTIVLTELEIQEALIDVTEAIVAAVKNALEQTPPELASDIIEQGLTLTGGGALLKNLDKLLTQETGVKAYVADDPLTCVVRGTGVVLEELDTIYKVHQILH